MPTLCKVLQVVSQVTPAKMSPQARTNAESVPVLPAGVHQDVPTHHVATDRVTKLCTPHLRLLARLRRPHSTVQNHQVHKGRTEGAFHERQVHGRRHDGQLHANDLLRQRHLDAIQGLVRYKHRHLQVFHGRKAVFINVVFSYAQGHRLGGQDNGQHGGHTRRRARRSGAIEE